MAKELIDIYVEQGYPYDFVLDMNDANDLDLESEYNCYFSCPSIGTKVFSVVADSYFLELTAIDTGLLDTNLEEYTVYTIKISDGSKDKLLSGRIILDKE